MGSLRTHTTTPYAVVVVYRARGEPSEEHAQCYRKHLRTALELARRTELTWLRLIGGQFSPLHWVVIDTRDYRRYNPFNTTIPGGSHGKNTGRAKRFHP
jgi:hypothetical protein